MEIRTMRPDDLAAVAALETEAFSDAWSQEQLLDSMGRSWNHFLVTEEGTRLTGYGCICVIAGEAELLRIAVDGAHRTCGIGRKLLEELIRVSRREGAKAMTLEVREGNLPARKLYETAGFREEARRKDYYQNPREDALILWHRGLE